MEKIINVTVSLGNVKRSFKIPATILQYNGSTIMAGQNIVKVLQDVVEADRKWDEAHADSRRKYS